MKIYIPKRLSSERIYVLGVIFDDILGFSDLEVIIEDRCDTFIDLDKGKGVFLPDILFSLQVDELYTSKALPENVVSWMSVPKYLKNKYVSKTPALYKKNSEMSLFNMKDMTIYFNIDFIGGAFFLLTRMEELISLHRDKHNRFPSVESVAVKNSFIRTPVVNQYAELIWRAIKVLSPQSKRKHRKWKVTLTHDVDAALSCSYGRYKRIPRVLVGDLVKRRSASLAFRRAIGVIVGFFGLKDMDPNNTYDYLMDQSNSRGLTSNFFFIFSVDSDVRSLHYNPDQPWIRKVIRNISSRGHRIGLHPSYDTYKQQQKMKEEADLMFHIAKEEGVIQSQWGGRQHALRWEHETWKLWDSLGMDYDSSMLFADAPGFRTGCCHEHALFDITSGQKLRLREKPLMTMDTSYRFYLKYNWEQIINDVSELANITKRFHGEFVLLWHQDEVLTPLARKNYEKMLDNIINRDSTQ